MFLWAKVIHVVAVIAWMAGLFYLPRLFVYHEMTSAGSATSEVFKVMEGRLLRAIMTPAAVVAWVFGSVTAWLGGWAHPMPLWLVLKVGLVVILTAFHIVLARFVAEFRAERRGRGDRFYRIINEIPTVVLIAIVILVVVKPEF